MFFLIAIKVWYDFLNIKMQCSLQGDLTSSLVWKEVKCPHSSSSAIMEHQLKRCILQEKMEI